MDWELYLLQVDRGFAIFFYKSVCLLIDGHSRIKLLACSVTIKDRHSRENAVLLL